ncbi:LOW QUALITY PROTEIN: ankyrin repeat, SAM and basic leucine zipper domain-containing protein 1 [Sceloporus undulatus]|uniref:LOW QUALITY PROTEIN: ankyrin repeat, SAM and basic leucine zipper domain-containing protein 1 n=1 Tax=Sceloporus undulatus TaxID=8520 RepID=UPI001C4CB66A|nr:LOW QUALITY PROTEIN: ankyrin repeat, SAM and basic leucine zipper domain-containing protein 1 [Sceloporus undulatus]
MTRGAFFGGSSESEDEDDGWDIGLVASSDRQEHLDKVLLIDDKDEALKKALTAGNLSAVEELLNSGVSVESTFKFGWTPLMYAASVANVELMHILLDRGANASFDKDQYTVLMAACTAHASEEQILKSVDLLLSRNANPNATCRKKMTPLMYAAREGHPQVVALLAGHGSQINAQDESGYTALTWAARYGHKKVVFKLLELGADKSIQTKDGQTPGEIAKNNRHSELFSLLSLMATPFQGRFQNLIKGDAIQSLLKAVPDGHKISSYGALGDLEVFLHGLGLEHITEALKERDITLRQLLTMGKEDFVEIGIKDQRDQQKILDAAKELQIEELNLGDLREVINVEFSGDEFLSFLVKLNKQCIHLTTAIQSAINQFPTDAHKLVLEWSPPQSLDKVCEDLISSAEDLNGQASKLKKLMQELHDVQRDNPCRIQPLVEKSRWKKSLFKIAAATLVGAGCLFFVSRLTLRIVRAQPESYLHLFL